MRNLISTIIFGMLIASFGCNNVSSNGAKSTKTNGDSAEIIDLVRNIYKWYIPNESQIYYDVIVKDSLQVGIDTRKLKEAILNLESSGYFNADFIKNYESIGMAVDNKLKKGKYYNDINFTFQDYDIWTDSQEDQSNLWEILKIKDLNITGDEASLKWYRGKDNESGYLVKMKKEKGKWKISYLEGLDYKKIVE